MVSLFHAPDRQLGAKEEATKSLLNYLLENNWIESELAPAQEASIIQEICRLINIFGKKELGFSDMPVTLGPALGKFNMCCVPANHRTRNKIITLTPRA